MWFLIFFLLFIEPLAITLKLTIQVTTNSVLFKLFKLFTLNNLIKI